MIFLLFNSGIYLKLKNICYYCWYTVSMQVSLSLSKLDKFSSMLHHTLVVFSQLLEVASLQEIGKCAEEILHYLNPITLASPVAAIHLVQQVRSLFSASSVLPFI